MLHNYFSDSFDHCVQIMGTSPPSVTDPHPCFNLGLLRTDTKLGWLWLQVTLALPLRK